MNISVRPAPRSFLHSLCVTVLFYVCGSSAIVAQAGIDLQIQRLIQRLQEQDKQISFVAIKEAKHLGLAAKAAIPTRALLIERSIE